MTDRTADPAESTAFVELHAERGPIPYVWADSVSDEYAPAESVEGVLTAGAMAVIYGESGCGKTYLALYLAICIALGRLWLGRRTHKGIVLYVACEAGDSIRNRIRAYQISDDVKAVDVALITVPVDLRSGPDAGRIIAACEQIHAERGEPVSVIIIDTLSRSFGGGNENDSSDMGSLVGNSDRIRATTRAAVLWVHHSGKDAAKGARGHSLLRAATDTEIEVSNRDGTIVATITKQRDGESGAELAGRLRPVEVGVNAWGGALTACIVEPVNEAPRAPRRQAARLNATMQIALDTLRAVVSDHGQIAPATSAIPPGRRVVDLERWRHRYEAAQQIDPTDDARERAKRIEARRKSFERARNELRAKALVGSIGGNWWIA